MEVKWVLFFLGKDNSINLKLCNSCNKKLFRSSQCWFQFLVHQLIVLVDALCICKMFVVVFAWYPLLYDSVFSEKSSDFLVQLWWIVESHDSTLGWVCAHSSNSSTSWLLSIYFPSEYISKLSSFRLLCNRFLTSNPMFFRSTKPMINKMITSSFRLLARMDV